jgi:tRNA-binding EMAP/Myf-like protein
MEMTVMVMEVKKAEKHPNAETLNVYQLSAPGCEQLQIIANQERVYQVGESVAIALVDSVLKDGTKIKATKLRGLYSYGMALGAANAPVGSDLSNTYCQPEILQSVQMQRWTSIELLHNVCRSLQAVEATPQVTYRAKVKLDGTNAAVQIFPNGSVAAQSRTQVITPENDNMGFAQWVSQNLDFFAQLASADHITIFGEWCGKGVQSRAAISQIDRKVFVIFAIQIIAAGDKIARLEVVPERLSVLIPTHPDIYVLPFYGDAIDLDFGDKSQLTATMAKLNQMVEQVEEADPWVKDTFGIIGIGEGLVLYPQVDTEVERVAYTELLFKAKGLKHQVVKAKQPVQISPELVKSIEEFVDFFVTPNRLEQGLTEACGGQCDMTQIGAFLKWFAMDVQKESVAELENAQLTWKDVSKAVNNAAKEWYHAKATAL